MIVSNHSDPVPAACPFPLALLTHDASEIELSLRNAPCSATRLCTAIARNTIWINDYNTIVYLLYDKMYLVHYKDNKRLITP